MLFRSLNKNALPRAALFPPMQKSGKVMQFIYQIITILIIIYAFFLRIQPTLLGLSVYGAGILLFALATTNFASPDSADFNQNGLYRLSRNPMYVAYFIYFLGCVILTKSLILLGLLCVFQISAHWIILAEEHWCTEKFGIEYTKYIQKVRRYI